MKVLDIKNLTIQKKGTKEVLLKDCSFSINSGEVVLLTGKNGLGKSTLLNVITRFQAFNGKPYAQYEGTIRFPEDVDLSYLFQKVIYIPQDDYISFPFTRVKKALLEGVPDTVKDKKQFLKSWIQTYKPFLVEDYDKKLLNKTINQLSGGERKYVSIVQALIRCEIDDIHLILIDEPVNSLDMRHIMQLSNLLLMIKERNVNLGMLIVSHCHAFPYINIAYEINDNKVQPETYICGSCFGKPNHEGFYYLHS